MAYTPGHGNWPLHHSLDSHSQLEFLQVALLLDCIRENLREDHIKLREEKVLSCSSTFWNASILNLVEFVLLPPDGGPPSLPEQCDKVFKSRTSVRVFCLFLICSYSGIFGLSHIMFCDE